MTLTQLKWLLCGLLLLGSWVGAFWLGGEHSRKVAAKDKLDSVLTIMQESQKQQKELQDKIDKLPKSETTIREIVRQNPAPFARPEPVSDGLREAIDKANSARKVPSDS